MIKTIFTFLLFFISLTSWANFPTDTIIQNQSVMFSTNQIAQINLNLNKRSGDSQMRDNSILSLATGIGFITAGAILESNRIKRNQPEVYGYSATAHKGFNYLVIGLGCGFTIGGGFYLIKSLR